MEDIYSKILEFFETGHMLVLATLIRLRGSAPRGVGTKCLILEDGSLEGTIGGGLLEARVLKEARKVFETRRPRRLPMVFRGEDVAQTEMLCGGEAEVFLEPLFPENREHFEIVQRTEEIRQEGGRGLLASVIHETAWGDQGVPRMLLEPNGRSRGASSGMEEIFNQCREAVPSLLRMRKPGIHVFEGHGGRKVEVFLEPVVFEPPLYIFGGGHVSRQIVPLAAGVGFKVTVIDDRPEFTDPALFPGASETKCRPFEGVLDHLPVAEGAYLVIVTRGHLYDKVVLQQCLKTDATYIGMIGSQRKIDMIYEKLLEEGFSEEDIRRVHAPIGLDIGAETPEEIAVSIVAELIKARAEQGEKAP